MSRFVSAVLIAICAMAFSAASVFAQDIPSLVGEWSTSGALNDHPFGITAANGFVYVTDQYTCMVEMFTTDGSPVRQWYTDPNPYTPHGIAVDSDNFILVARTGRQVVGQYTPNGTLWNMYGSLDRTDGLFVLPEDVCTDQDGNIYVIDRADRIQKLSSSGDLLASFPFPGSTNCPDGIAVSQFGDIFVSDFDGNRVVRFNAAGVVVHTWGSPGSGDGQFQYPSGIAVDLEGNVYVADSHNCRIQKFRPDGTCIMKWDVAYNGIVADVAVDSDGSIYVLDYDNRMVLKYALPLPTPTKKATWGQLKTRYR
jgi:DNA-binding beta-propeller fold protein YncE